jgi:GT2 family glycosyltransferase
VERSQDWLAGGAGAVTEAVRIAAIMLTLNQRETTLRALASLMPQLGPRDRVVVWDNGSHDGTVEAVTAAFPSVCAHHHESNLGVASGRNAGARLALERFDPEYLLFLDNDLVLQPGYVVALVGTLESNPSVGQVQSKLLYLDEPTRINDGGGCRIRFWLGRTDPVGFKEIDRGQCEEVAPCVSCGGSMMVRASLFRELGGFDSVFDPFGPEDLDFSLRLQALGHRALYNPRAVALHAVNHTFEGEGGYTEVYARSKAKHWLRFLRRHGTPSQRVGFYAVGAPLIAVRMVFRELLKGNPGAITGSVRGMMEAIRGSGRSP